MSIKFHTVTWYSRLAATIVFIFMVPALMFYIGRQYQGTVDTLHGFVRLNVPTKSMPLSPLDATYTIDNVPITLVKGVSEKPIMPGSASAVTTKAFGQPAYGDFNGDGLPDAVFFLT